VVQRAQRAAAETSGAMSGATVAAYLRGDAEAKPASDKILERLTLPQAAVPETSAAAHLVETVDQLRLEGLTKAAEPAAPPPGPGTEPEKSADLDKANEKLAGLVQPPR